MGRRYPPVVQLAVMLAACALHLFRHVSEGDSWTSSGLYLAWAGYWFGRAAERYEGGGA